MNNDYQARVDEWKATLDGFKPSKATTPAIPTEQDRMQEMASKHIATMESLDMTKIGDVIDWLHELLKTINEDTKWDWWGVDRELRSAGYDGNYCCGGFDDTADGNGRWLIYRFQEVTITRRHELNSFKEVFDIYAKDWHDRFGTVK